MITCILSGTMLLCAIIGIAGGALMHRGQRCSGVNVVLLDSAVNHFLNADDVRRIVRSEIGGCTNKYISDINLHQVESILSRNGSLNSHEAYFTPDGMLNIEVSQKTPVVKFICEGKVYYADIEGNCFNVGKDWATELLTVKGHPMISDSKWLRQAAGSIRWLDGKKNLSERITSISSDKNGKLSIRLEGRSETFHLGSPVDMAGKFYRIRRYEEDIVPMIAEEKTYSEVNVEYKGQIICK